MGQIGACIFAGMKCKHCSAEDCIRKGKRKDKQRYYCKNCKHSFQEFYRYKAWEPAINTWIRVLLKEGCGIRSISRILKIAKKTVLSRILEISNSISPPGFAVRGCSYEMDELRAFTYSKANGTWVAYCMERTTKTVIDFFVGSRTKKNVEALTATVLSLHPKKIYTDRLPLYTSLIPEKIHSVFRYGTNRIERNNLTLRTHVKRRSRRTVCFSKKQEYLKAHLKIYFWGDKVFSRLITAFWIR